MGKKEWCCRVHGRVAPTRAVGARHLPSLTTAMRGSPIGWLAGVFRRSPGAVQTKVRVAPLQLEDVLELGLGWLVLDHGTGPAGHLLVPLAGWDLETARLP